MPRGSDRGSRIALKSAAIAARVHYLDPAVASLCKGRQSSKFAARFCKKRQRYRPMRSTAAYIMMMAGVARALVSRGGPRVAARQLRTSQPLRMAASTLEGLRNVAIVAHVRRSVRKQCRVKRVHSPRRRANAAPDARPQQRNMQPSRRRAVKNTHNTRRSTTARRR